MTDLGCLVANALWRACGTPASHAFARALADPAAAQWRRLRAQLTANGDTEYGRRFGFASMRSVADFQARVPVVGYDELDPLVRRVRAGEHGVLTAEPVLRLVPSGGSTGGRKLIPWTRTLAREFGGAVRAWTADVLARRPAVRTGPAYWSVSPALEGESPDERGTVPVGFDEDTAYLGGPLGWLVGRLLAVPEEVRHAEDVETFRYLTALGLLRDGELRLLSVWHPSFLELLLDALERHFEELVSDVARGTVTPPGPVPPKLVPALRRWRVPRRRRARSLAAGGPEPLCCWPRLALVSCWGDGPARGPAGALGRRFPGVELQPKGLLATEGVVTIPFRDARPVAVLSHFFEFLDASGAARTVSELSEGESYSVVLTTGGGLYRYRLNDTVRVEGFLDRTPSLSFVAKEDHVSDLRGEKLDARMVARALERLFGQGERFALLAPEERGGSAWYTLFVDGDAALPEGLAEALDRALAENPGYGTCRRLGQLERPLVFRVGRSAHAAYIDAELARGLRLGDVKPAALSARTDWRERFLGAGVATPAGRS